jgi:2-polyprenyl-3-methyl-5-hydroxy-6-metoxy-1,4-benzoquinol methylase
MTSISIWGQAIPLSWLTESDLQYLDGLPRTLPVVQWVWQEMDRVWDSFGLDNARPLSQQNVGAFYSHPVWLMNGFFSALDPVSAQHRQSIAAFLARDGAHSVADFGGGFGELALAIAAASTHAEVSIVEPFPNRAGMQRIAEQNRVRFVSKLQDRTFDAVVAQDVLEHVEDPVLLAFEISKALKAGGIAIFANCFQPVIKCHLPSTFHLRHTFPWVMRGLGLDFVGVVQGATHAQVFRRGGPMHLRRARRIEGISRAVHPWLNGAARTLGRAKRLLTRS